MRRSDLRRILEELSKAPSNPGFIAGKTGLPRYDVLASFHVLEILGFIKPIYARGTHKVYTVTELGLKLLQGLIRGEYVIDVRLPEENASPGEAVAGIPGGMAEAPVGVEA